MHITSSIQSIFINAAVWLDIYVFVFRNLPAKEGQRPKKSTLNNLDSLPDEYFDLSFFAGHTLI